MTEEQRTLPPPMPKDAAFVQPQRDDGRTGPYIVAEVTPLEEHLKAGQVQGFSVRCDEGVRLGGTDTAPSPLAYFCVAVGF